MKRMHNFFAAGSVTMLLAIVMTVLIVINYEIASIKDITVMFTVMLSVNFCLYGFSLGLFHISSVVDEAYRKEYVSKG